MNFCMTYPCRRTSAGCPVCDPHQSYTLPPTPVFTPPGCICPPTSEKTCEAPMCPRKNPFKSVGALTPSATRSNDAL